MKKSISVFLFAVCLASQLTTTSLATDKIATNRDEKGVWFINGPQDADLYDVFEEMGYAVAEDRLWQMELYRRQALGRLAELFGPDSLETDIFMRTIGYSERELQVGFDGLDAESQSVISGYVAGINRRIAEIGVNPSLLPFEFVALSEIAQSLIVPDPWTETDVLAWAVAMQRLFDPEALETDQLENAELLLDLSARFGISDAQQMFDDLRWTRDPESLTYIGYHPDGSSDWVTEPIGGHWKKLNCRPRKAAANIRNMRQRIKYHLRKINAEVKMGSYAWVISGRHTKSGNPIIYSGPQMGFFVPSITVEGSIRAGGLEISGMTVPGIPGIIIGRTPHHAWSMQVGHAHTTDYYIENPGDVTLHRFETIKVFGGLDVDLPIFRSEHGPIVNPIPFDPMRYVPSPDNPVVAWEYADWGYEFDFVKALLQMARARNLRQFHQAVRRVAVSQHFCYADRKGNIAYWMSGRDPIRPQGEWRLPQGLISGGQEWDGRFVRPLPRDHNTKRGWYAGWNNRSSCRYPTGFNSVGTIYGPFHRTHVIYRYLDKRLSRGRKVSFEDLRDLALNIATTDSFGNGGNPWEYVAKDFVRAVKQDGLTRERRKALRILRKWNGHFVRGGPNNWAFGQHRSDAWILMDKWIRKVLEMTFRDELGEGFFEDENKALLFNVLLHGLNKPGDGIRNRFDWFRNADDEGSPQTADEIIVAALDIVLADLGPRPWGRDARGEIVFRHDLLGTVHTIPFSSRSTYAHCVEYGWSGPVRIESMFPLGQSGNIAADPSGPSFDMNFFSMIPVYDGFTHRDFPLFK